MSEVGSLLAEPLWWHILSSLRARYWVMLSMVVFRRLHHSIPSPHSGREYIMAVLSSLLVYGCSWFSKVVWWSHTQETLVLCASGCSSVTLVLGRRINTRLLNTLNHNDPNTLLCLSYLFVACTMVPDFLMMVEEGGRVQENLSHTFVIKVCVTCVCTPLP